MGAWAAGSSDNDAAADFLADLADLADFAALASTLTTLENVKGPLDADDASTAVAACDLLAITIGRPPADLPDDLPRFDTKTVPGDLLATARKLLKRLRKTSELTEPWAEDDDAEWQPELDDLLVRLTPSKPYKAAQKRKRIDLPDDLLGYCYVCFGPVTARDGLVFEDTTEDVGTCKITPHRHCIEGKVTGPSWNADGSPSDAARKVLMQGLGFDV